MRNLKFHLAKATNIMCFGPDGVQFHFKDYGNVVQVKGINLDNPGTDEDPASNGAGKCFGIDTPILMYNGSIKMVQDIKEGDLVMGDDSTPRRVLSLSRGREELYEVMPKKGDSYVVNKSHILTLKSASKKHQRFVNHFSRNGDIFNLSVRDYLSETKTFKHMMKGYRASIDFTESFVVLDPYILGIWLGYGTSSKTQITTVDNEILDAIKEFANKEGLSVRSYKESYNVFSEMNKGRDCCHNWFRTCLKLYHLFDNKHIPDQYKHNSREVRLKVLAGLLDTDGSLSHSGFDFINKNEKLVDDLVYLSRSLGLAAYKSECRKSCQNGFTGTYWRVSISGDCSIIPVRIARKKCPARKINKDPLKVGIELRPLGMGDYYGFSVDGNQLFLLGDFTVVHNSSLQEILSIGLYGRSVKHPTKLKGGNLINTLAQKGEVEVIWDNYRVIRELKLQKSGSVSGKLRIWESKDHIWDKGSEFDPGKGRHAAQDWIEDKLGLTHHAFCNVVIFDDSSTYSFLEADTPTKRQIVENLLGLDQYRQYHQNAKDYLKDQKVLVNRLGEEYNFIQEAVAMCDDHIKKAIEMESKWKKEKQEEGRQLLARLNKKQELLASGDTGKQLANWHEGQARIEYLTNEIIALETKCEGVSKALDGGRSAIDKAISNKDIINVSMQEHSGLCTQLEVELKGQRDLLYKLSALEDGARCPTCHGVISEENYGHVKSSTTDSMAKCRQSIHDHQVVLESLKADFGEKSKAVATMRDTIAKAEAAVTSHERTIREHRAEVSKLSQLPKPEGDATQKVLEAEITELRRQLKSCGEEFKGDSPYKEILDQANKEKGVKDDQKLKKETELKEAESEIPYILYWAEAFGDNGIRKFVVDGVIPALNNRVAYWMQYLIDSKIKLTFNNKLEETIVRHGNAAFYYSMSNGERRRINLAVSQAFAYVMMLNSGSCPSLVFLDEITGGGIDRAGVVGIYNMIFELAKERQVFVTTHNENLLTMLQGCEKITLKKQNDITVLV